MELFNDFKDFLKERVKNPFLGSLTFFWFIFNWKPLLIILLSKEPIEYRISVASFTYFNFWDSFFYPILFGFLYTVAISHIFHFFEKITSKIYSERKETYYKRVTIDYKSRETVAKAKFDYEQAEQDYKNQKELNDKIISLELKIKEKDKNIEENKLHASSLESEINKLNQIINHQLKLLFNRTEIQDLYNQYTIQELNEAGEAISTILTYLGEKTDYDLPKYINSIKKIGAGEIILNDTIIIDLNLNKIGYFLFFRSFYIDKSLQKHYYSVFPGHTLK